MSIENAIRDAFKQKRERCWDTIYFAIDLHNTILLPHSDKMYPYAFETLRLLSLQKDIALILFTATKREILIPFLDFCKRNEIVFKYLNENTECKNTKTGDYTKKFYFNVLLDDRAGFDPKDWKKVFNILFSEICCPFCHHKLPYCIWQKRAALLKRLGHRR